MWHTEKDSREASRYIQGFLYYYSNATGVDVYRYLRYDHVDIFARRSEAVPEAAQSVNTIFILRWAMCPG